MSFKSFRKRKEIKICSLVAAVLLTGCNAPIAPLQADTGTVYNYSRNYRTKQSVNNTAKVSKSRDGTVTVNGIPIFKQGNDNTCGQASMASILNFWGIKTTYQAVINDTNLGNAPTDLEVIAGYLVKKGLEAKAYKKSTLSYLKSLVDKGQPPIVLLDFGGLSNEHYVVVSGYNETKGTILYNDSRNGPFISVSATKFDQMWQNKSLGNLLIFGDKFDRPIFEITGLQ